MTAEKFHDALTLLSADLVAEADKIRSRQPKVISWRRYSAIAACLAMVVCSSLFFAKLFGPKGAAGNTKEAPAEAAVMQAQKEDHSAHADSAPEDEAAKMQSTQPTAPARQESTSADIQTDTASGSSTAEMGTLYPGISQPKYVNTPPDLSGSACFVTPSPKLILSRADLDAYLNKTPSQFLLDELAEVCKDYDDAWFEEHDLLLIPLCTVPADDLPEVTAIQEQDGHWNICIENYRQYYAEDAQPEYTDLHILLEVEKGLITTEDTITILFE